MYLARSYLHHSKMLFLWWVRIYFQASVLYFFALFHLSPIPVSFLWGEGRPEFNGLNSSSSSSSPSSYFFASSHTTNLSPKSTPIPVKSLSADSPAQTGKGLIEMETGIGEFPPRSIKKMPRSHIKVVGRRRKTGAGGVKEGEGRGAPAVSPSF